MSLLPAKNADFLCDMAMPDKRGNDSSDKTEPLPFAAASECPSVYDRLWNEYQIIQDKIDKAADFRYRVRGWSVTITTGLLAASTATKIPWWYSLVGLAPVLLFAINEHNQRCIGNALGHRAVEIEEELEAIDVKAGKGSPLLLGAAPQFGRQLRKVVKAGRQLTFGMRKLHSGIRRKSKPRSTFLQRFGESCSHKWDWVTWRSDNLFYLGQVIVILIVGVITGYKDGFAFAVPERQNNVVTNYVFGVKPAPPSVAVYLTNSFSPSVIVTNTILVTNRFEITNSVNTTSQQVAPK